MRELEFTTSEISVYYGERLPKLPQRGREWRGPCPVHGGKRDSFAVNPETGAAYCHSSCAKGWNPITFEQEIHGGTPKEAVERVKRIIGRVDPAPVRKRIVATCDYVDEDGQLLFQTVRYEPKTFRQRQRNGKGGWTWNVKGVRIVPYRLPKVLGADQVIIVEGEKDVHTLEELGYVATCNPMGAGKWRDEYSEFLRGRDVVILPDNDVPGDQHARQVASSLEGLAKSIRILRLPDLPSGGDVTDWIRAGGKHEQLAELISGAPELTAAEPEPPAAELFHMTKEGLFAINPRTQKFERISPPVEILAGTASFTDENVGKLVRYRGRGRERISVIPHTKLIQEGGDALDEMVNRGFKPKRGRRQRESLKDYIWNTEPKKLVRCVDQIGWYHRCYVTPEETIGQYKEPIIFYSEIVPEHKLHTSGTLEGWREHVARLCAGNSRLAFCVSAAFAAAMLTPLRHENPGFHIRGGSSIGKTTALLAAGSVWGGDPRKGYIQTWRSTSNGLEATAALHNDSLLCLDEISQAPPKEIGEMIYNLGNGTTKRRMTRGITARRAIEYSLVYISTGERRLGEIMRSVGERAKGGQDLRLIDIEADAGAGFGLFERIHEFERADELARTLAAASQQYYGTAIRAFLEHAVTEYDLARDSVREMREQFVRAHASEGSSTEVQRVAATFGLVAGAGELATRWGITGWREGEARSAARLCYASWLAVRGSTGALDIEYGIQAVRDFIALYDHTRFYDCAVEPQRRQPIQKPAGYRERVVSPELEEQINFYIHEQVFREEICGAYDYVAVFKEMIRRGYGKTHKGKNLAIKKMLDGKWKRVFAVLPKLFEE